MNENEWDQIVKAELVEGPVERVNREEVVKVIREMKAGKAAGPSEVRVEMIAASGEIGIGIMVEVCWMEEECQMIRRRVLWYQFSRGKGKQ